MSPLFLKIINLTKWKTTDLFPYLVSFLNVWSDVYISMYIKDFRFGTFPSISGSGYTFYRAPIRTNNYCPLFCCNWKTWRNDRVKMYTELYCQLYKEMRIAYTLSRSHWCVRVILSVSFFRVGKFCFLSSARVSSRYVFSYVICFRIIHFILIYTKQSRLESTLY